MQGSRKAPPRGMTAIRVDNIPLNVNRREVIALFNTLIGDVRGSSDVMAASGTHLEIYFNSPDAAKKALCMSGYTIAGTALIVTPLAPAMAKPRSGDGNDDRRNLYVLGLPYDLNKTDFAAAFSSHGTVSHCVILATVDNASRRRGFVVMSNHEEARRAMAGLNRSQIRGHTIDVSWAIVQRSHGFLDGPDRALFFDGRPPRSSSPSSQDESPTGIPSASESPDALGSVTVDAASRPSTSPVPSTALLVSNLPKSLFSQAQDLEPLLSPFGTLKKLQVLDETSDDATSVVVEYGCVDSATDAKSNLDGQTYLNLAVKIEYVRQDPPLPFPLDRSASRASTHGTEDSFGRFARSRPSSRLASVCDPMPPPNSCYAYPSSFASAYSAYHYGYATPSPQMQPCNNQTLSRSSSASSGWSTDSTDSYFQPLQPDLYHCPPDFALRSYSY